MSDCLCQSVCLSVSLSLSLMSVCHWLWVTNKDLALGPGSCHWQVHVIWNLSTVTVLKMERRSKYDKWGGLISGVYRSIVWNINWLFYTCKFFMYQLHSSFFIVGVHINFKLKYLHEPCTEAERTIILQTSKLCSKFGNSQVSIKELIRPHLIR